jgi:hypothetical protein
MQWLLTALAVWCFSKIALIRRHLWNLRHICKFSVVARLCHTSNQSRYARERTLGGGGVGKVVATPTAARPPHTGPGPGRRASGRGPPAACRGASGPASLPFLAALLTDWISKMLSRDLSSVAQTSDTTVRDDLASSTPTDCMFKSRNPARLSDLSPLPPAGVTRREW